MEEIKLEDSIGYADWIKIIFAENVLTFFLETIDALILHLKKYCK